MKKLGVRILTFLLCIALFVPQHIVQATEPNEENTVKNDDDINEDIEDTVIPNDKDSKDNKDNKDEII